MGNGCSWARLTIECNRLSAAFFHGGGHFTKYRSWGLTRLVPGCAEHRCVVGKEFKWVGRLNIHWFSCQRIDDL